MLFSNFSIKLNIKKYLVFFLLGGVLNAHAQSFEDAKMAIDSERYQQAKEYLEALVEVSPEVNPEYYYYLGYIELVNLNFEKAKEYFDEGIRLFPEAPINHIGLGTYHMIKNDTQKMNQAYSNVMSNMKRKEYMPLYFIGRDFVKYKENMNPDSALFYLEKAVQYGKDDPNVYVSMGDAYAMKKNNSEAIKNYEKALSMQPNMHKAILAKGVIWRLAYNWPESVKEFEKIITKEPNYAPAYRELAETYLSWGRSEPKLFEEKIAEAVKNYKKYLEITDLSKESKMRYADFLILSERWEELEKIARELAGYKEKNLRIYRYLGYAAYENKNYADAYGALEKFVKNTPPERHISLDYEYYFKSIADAGYDDKINISEEVNKVVSKYPELVDFIKDIADKYYKNKKYDKSADLYELYLKHTTKKSLSDYFKHGLSCYWAANISISSKAKSGSSTETIVLSDNEDKWLKTANKQFHFVDSVSTQPIEQVPLYQSRIAYFYDQNAEEGLQKPFFEKYIKVTRDKLLNGNNFDAVVKHLKSNEAFFMDFKKYALLDESVTKETFDASANQEKIHSFIRGDKYYHYLFEVLPKAKNYRKNVGAAYSYLGFYYDKREDKDKALEYFITSNKIDPNNQQAAYYVKIYEDFEKQKEAYEKKQADYQKKLKEYKEKKGK